MFGLVRKKTLEDAIQLQVDLYRAWKIERNQLCVELADQEAIIESTERAKVLADLQTALYLIQDYQRILRLLSASDPQVIQADNLLRRWGFKSETKSYLGAERPTPLEPSLSTQEADLRSLVNRPPKSHIEEEEDRWGDEAYGSDHVKIMAERTDEGDRVWFEPLDEYKGIICSLDEDEPALSSSDDDLPVDQGPLIASALNGS